MPTEQRDSVKTRRSTFANFIHKKDAAIACHVVCGCLLENIPVYTVHDNFITPAAHSLKFPSFYNLAFLDLAPPPYLYLVNRLIEENLISYSSYNSLMNRKEDVGIF